MKRVVQYFIQNPLIGNVITVFVILAGIIMYRSIQKEAYPQVDEPGMSIIAHVPGAGSAEVELEVAAKIEGAVKGVEGVKNYTTLSIENQCVSWVIFDDDTDLDEAKEKIRRNLDNINDFPHEMTTRPVVGEWGSAHMDLLRIGLSGDVPYQTLKDKTEELEERIDEHPDVARFEIWGEREHEIQILVDLEKLNAMYLTFDEIITAIQSQNIELSGGTISSYDSEKTIVTRSKFVNAADIEAVILRSNMEGDMVRLTDVATVEDTYAEEKQLLRYNGHKGLALIVFKKQHADIVKTVEGIKKIIDEYQAEIEGSGVEISIVQDNSSDTKSRLHIVENNAITGLLLVALILFLFLNFKNALWTVIGVPFSICMGLLIMGFTGITINSVTLLSMIIVLGMLVDDTIIIAENTHRHRIVDGTDGAVTEVGFAVLTSVLTTVIAFAPLLVMEGVVGKYVHHVPVVILYLLGASLFEAFFILPAHITHVYTKWQKALLGFVLLFAFFYGILQYFQMSIFIRFFGALIAGTGGALLFVRFYRDEEMRVERPYVHKLRTLYGLVVLTVIRYRYIVFLFFLLVMGVAVTLVSRMRFEMFPAVEANNITIQGEVRENNSLLYTADKISEIEKYIREKYDEKTVRSYISYIGGDGKSSKFALYLFLTPEKKRKIKSDALISDLRIRFVEDQYTKMTYEKSDGGPRIDNTISIEVHGNNDHFRKELSKTIFNDLKTTRGVLLVNSSDMETEKEIRITPNSVLIARNGVTPEQIARLTHIAFEGYTVTDLKSPEEKVPVRIILADKYRQKLETLAGMMIRTSSKNLESLDSLVTVSEVEGVTRIKRYNGKRTTTVYAEFDTKVITAKELYDLLKKRYDGVSKKYPGTRVHLGGPAEYSNQSLNSLQSTLVIAIAAIFVILVFLFRSVTQPFIVMLAVPFGLMGVIFAFRLHGMPLSFMGIMGAIGLSGVVVNDSLVMVDYINRLKAKAPSETSLTDLVLQGAKTRLRPIILTTATTFAGLLPTAYGLGGSDPFILPTAISLSWGLFFSTTLVLLLLPGFYMIEDDVIVFFKKVFSRFL